MRYLFSFLFLFVLLFSVVFSQDKASIAVLELEAGGISIYEAQVLSDRLRTELFKTDKFVVLERDKMDEILVEQGFQLSGCTTNECIVEAGKLIGVKQMIAGKIAKIENLYTINIRLIDVQTSKVIQTATEDCECTIKDVLTNSIRNVARSMAGLSFEEKVSKVKSYPSKTKEMNSKISLTEWEEMGITREEYLKYKKSGLTLNEWLKQNKELNPTTALLLSIFIPGTGQYYNGDYFKGIVHQAGTVGGILLFTQAGWDYVDGDKTKVEANGLFYVGFGVALGSWIWSWIDARASAIEYNKKLKYQLSFNPKFNNYSKKPMLGVSINF